MPYKCAYSHTCYDPLCDACDSATTSDNPYNYEQESRDKLKAAIKGMTLKEYRKLDCDEE